MSLVFASICPHPPIIIPEIGEEALSEVEDTKKALEKLAKEFQNSTPEIVILVSPHGPVFPDKMAIKALPSLEGNLALFGALKVNLKFEGDEQIARTLADLSQQNGIPTFALDEEKLNFYNLESSLDHGSLVPLYYLTQKGKFKDFTLIPISFSYLSLEDHFRFGKVLSGSEIFQNFKIAVVASGDLSHTLTYDAPAGYTPSGKEFDEKLVSLLKENKVEEIKNLDPFFIEEAAECGFRSILILLGVLSNYKYKPEILSYEGPFGVGYLVANFEIKE